MESFELDACIDCTLTIAGYDDTETGRDLSASRAGLERMSADNGGADVILSPATDPEWSEPIDEFFSGAPCDVCLSPLGGTRVLHDVVVLPFRPIDSAAV